MNETARAFLGDCTGRTCSATLMARDPDGSRVCHSTCATPRGERVREGRISNGALIRGERHRLVCSPMDDGTVVVLEPCKDVDVSVVNPTGRECEVLYWIARGETDKDIAVRFGVKASTIRTHTERARRKLGATTRAQAVARALSLGLI